MQYEEEDACVWPPTTSGHLQPSYLGSGEAATDVLLQELGHKVARHHTAMVERLCLRERLGWGLVCGSV